MKYLAMSFLLIVGCGSAGQEYQEPFPFDYNKVVWSGNASDKPEYLDLFNRVSGCLNQTAPPPDIYILDEYSLVYNYVEVWGCVINNNIYVSSFALNWYQGAVLSHEYIHYITGIGDELHGSEIMNKCGGIRIKN